jgi:hypothetical protein
MNRWEYANFDMLKGKTLKEVLHLKKGGEKISFIVDDQEAYHMEHFQDCCEAVWVEDVCGDLNDLVGTPILFAEVSSSEDQSVEWTFYRIGTIKGTVVIRWCGELDTYYSIEVSFYRTSGEDTAPKT